MKSSAVWATSRQPWSMVRAWPRFGSTASSVTARLRRCRLSAAFAIAHGTVWSFSPSMMSRGPRSGFFVLAFASVRGLMFALPICTRDPGAGDVVCVVELLRLLLVQGVRPAVLELVEGERDRAAAGARVDQERTYPPEHGGRQRQNAAEDPGIDRHRGRREAPAREHLRQQAAGRVPTTAGVLSRAWMI